MERSQKQNSKIDIIEEIYSNNAWFERVTRRFKADDRAICLEYHTKISKHLVNLELELLETQILLSKELEKKRIILGICNHYKTSWIFECIKEILK